MCISENYHSQPSLSKVSTERCSIITFSSSPIWKKGKHKVYTKKGGQTVGTGDSYGSLTLHVLSPFHLLFTLKPDNTEGVCCPSFLVVEQSYGAAAFRSYSQTWLWLLELHTGMVANLFSVSFYGQEE